MARLEQQNYNHRSSTEIRDVKLIGTIYQKPLVIDTGAKVLTIKTVNSNDEH